MDFLAWLSNPVVIVGICIVFGIPIVFGIIRFVYKKKTKKDLNPVPEAIVNMQERNKKKAQKKAAEKNAQHVRDVVEKFNKNL